MMETEIETITKKQAIDASDAFSDRAEELLDFLTANMGKLSPVVFAQLMSQQAELATLALGCAAAGAAMSSDVSVGNEKSLAEKLEDATKEVEAATAELKNFNFGIQMFAEFINLVSVFINGISGGTFGGFLGIASGVVTFAQKARI